MFRPSCTREQPLSSSTSATSPPLPLGKLVERVTLDSLKISGERAEITDTGFVSSYNWIEDSSPKIMVPGKPPAWTPPRGSIRLSWDKGKYYRDINAASYPLHPMEPTIISIMKMNLNPLPVDIVACGSTLGNLLRFSGASKLERDFRVLVEVVGDTVHLVRRENSPREIISNVKGYGHTFPEAYTTWDEGVKRSISHQRVVRYQFGGFHIMVRFEGDGCIETPKRWRDSGQAMSSVSPTGDNLDNISTLEISHRASSVENETYRLQVVEGGKGAPLETIFDLKTRSGYYNTNPRDTLEQQIHRLWVSQVKQLIVAYHNRGMFAPKDIIIMKVEDDVKRWENKKQTELMRLTALLHLIVNRARKAPDRKLEIVCSPNEPLEIREQSPGSSDFLSNRVRKDWVTWLQNAQPHETESSAQVPMVNVVEDNQETIESDEEGNDYVACDTECGYCGKCSY